MNAYKPLNFNNNWETVKLCLLHIAWSNALYTVPYDSDQKLQQQPVIQISPLLMSFPIRILSNIRVDKDTMKNSKNYNSRYYRISNTTLKQAKMSNQTNRDEIYGRTAVPTERMPSCLLFVCMRRRLCVSVRMCVIVECCGKQAEHNTHWTCVLV